MIICFFSPQTDPHPVDPDDPGVYRMVVGWAKRPDRRAGELADIKFREAKNEWACARCGRRLERGVSVGQEALL